MHLFLVSLWGVFCVVIVNNLQPKTYAQKVSNVFFFFTLIEYHNTNTKCIYCTYTNREYIFSCLLCTLATIIFHLTLTEASEASFSYPINNKRLLEFLTNFTHESQLRLLCG